MAVLSCARLLFEVFPVQCLSQPLPDFTASAGSSLPLSCRCAFYSMDTTQVSYTEVENLSVTSLVIFLTVFF